MTPRTTLPHAHHRIHCGAAFRSISFIHITHRDAAVCLSVSLVGMHAGRQASIHPASLSPRDSRRRQPTVAAADHARLAESSAVCTRYLPSQHAPTHPAATRQHAPETHAQRRSCGRPLHAERPVLSKLAPTTCPCDTRRATGTSSASACVALEETNATHTVRVGVVTL